MLDDDVLCEALYPPYQKDQLRLSNSNIIDVFASEADWRSEARPTGFDPLAGHLRHLGQDLHTCLKHYNGKGLSEAEMENMLEAETRHLQADSRILISECGAWGDPGCPLHTLLLNSNPHSTERMLARDPDLGHSFGKRQLRSIQQSVKIDHIANIAQITGVDNSALLPPYFPALRGEDGLFGSLVHYLYPESRVLTHNWGVPHLPMDERSGGYRDEAVIPPVHIGAITRYIDEQYQLAATGSTTNRYAFIAGVLRDFASKPQAELLALARREGQRGAAAVHARAAERLPYFSGKSPAFTAYLQYAQQSAAEWLRQPPSLAAQFGMPAELPEADVITAITGAVSSFAGGLDEWPAIREAVIAINQQN